MSTDHATLQATAAARWKQRITEYFTIADRWDFDSFGDYLSPDLQFQFANHPPFEGLDTMLGFAAKQKTLVSSVSHTLHSFHTDVDTRTVAVELTVRYVRLDNSVAEYPAAVVLEFDAEDLITAYRVYVDLSDLV